MNKPLTFTIFGSTGDLTYRKLLPALYQLETRHLLPETLRIRCIGRKDLSTQSYLESALPWLQKGSRFPFDQVVYDRFIKHISYIEMSLTELDDYKLLNENTLESDHLYYFAVAPEFFEIIANHLKDSGCLRSGSHGVILEKPFGVDENHARYLNERLSVIFGEDNIYRIDHYLGKEMIQNILTIRFANRLFEGIWNKDYIQEIQITASETIGVENRGAYYEQAGAIQDMVQNHLLQLLSYVLMDKPHDFSPLSIQSKQVDVLKDIKIKHLVLGQYDKRGDLQSYREESKVDPQSQTETYVALELEVEDDRFLGVPIFLRTGKRLNQKATYISVIFKPVEGTLFEHLAPQQEMLIIKIAPDEGVYFRFNAKKPGLAQQVTPVMMDFCQSCIYENRINTPEAYERLLNDAFQKDKTLFTSWNMVDLTWSFASTLAQFRKDNKVQLELYPSDGFGPKGAKTHLKEKGSLWIPADITDEAFT
jgi:glucose-6-phosphate 1-dehydrogenase